MSAQLESVQFKVGEKVEPGFELLSEVRKFISRFCAFPDDHCLTAVTLWVAHAHMVEHFYTTPRLAFLSPEPSSGKTRALEVLDLLVPESMFVFNASPAAIFRSLAETQKTLLFDECDAIWSKKGRDENHEDLRALLNAGYKRGAKIPRCTGKNHEVTHFDAYSAVALAGLGELPDTIMTRSVIIKMRRRAPNEHVEPFRLRRHEPEGKELRERLAGWALSVGEDAGEAWPQMPPGVVDRNEEIWEPLIAVADAAEGDWPKRAREACTGLIKAADDRPVSLGIRLLDDIRKVFKERDVTRMHTQRLLDNLTGLSKALGEDAPWADLYGEGLNARKLAALLRPYGIKPKKLKIGDVNLNGYSYETLSDAWTRYSPTPNPVEAEQAELPEPISVNSELNGGQSPQLHGDVPEVPDVPDSRGMEGGLTI